MFDTMTLTKVVGGLCGALLIFLLGGWFAEDMYHVGGGHGDGEEHASGYVIDTGADETTDTAEAAPEVPFADVFAVADVAKGEKVFSKCKACHSLEEGKKGAGPSLYAIVDRAVASTDFGYSDALPAVVDNWTPEHLNGFLEDPKGYTPGTKMNFKGLPKIADRANLIAYLQTVN